MIALVIPPTLDHAVPASRRLPPQYYSTASGNVDRQFGVTERVVGVEGDCSGCTVCMTPISLLMCRISPSVMTKTWQEAASHFVLPSPPWPG
jgi:hypothetical protein